MSSKKCFLKSLIFSLVILFAIGLLYIPCAHAQNWWPLPPYNTLWPLWSPVLSPPNPITGTPVPIVSSLRPDTVLPVQPGLTWDPALKYPWLLYNTPVGMVYYDPLYGIGLWPPGYLLGIFGNPLPLTILAKDLLLAPTSTLWLQTNVPIANNAYYSSYPRFAPLLTPATIVGLPPL